MRIQRRSPWSLCHSCTCALDEAQKGGTAIGGSEWYYWEGYFYSLPESVESAVNNKHHRRVMTAEDLSPTVRCCKAWMPIRPLLFWLCRKKKNRKKKIPLFSACVADWSYCCLAWLHFLCGSLREKRELNWGFLSPENSHEGKQSHSQLRAAVSQETRLAIALHHVSEWG